MTYEGEVFHIPVSYSWNSTMLSDAFLILDTPQSELRFRYWAATSPNLTSITILTKAIEHGVRFSLAIPQTAIPKYRPKNVDDLDDGAGKEPHQPGFIEPPLTYGRGGVALREAYTVRAKEITTRSNAGALIAMGGPTSWLARKFSRNKAIKKLMNGPSHLVTWYNKSNNDSLDKQPLHIVWEEENWHKQKIAHLVMTERYLPINEGN